MRRQLFLILCAGFLVLRLDCKNGDYVPDPTAGLYHNYEEVDNGLHQLASDNSRIAQVTSIGKSLEGRELWAIKISDHVTSEEDEPCIALLGAHHAREWISVDVPFLVAEYFLDHYAADTTITRFIDNAEIWIVPMVNPDGHQYSVMKDRLWRKNRRNNGDGTYGVDLNRNYGHEWGGPGSSGDSYSETYRGPSPFSEPESRVVRDFLTDLQPDVMISYHNYSQLILYPWGHTYDPAADEALLDRLAVRMSEEIKAVHGVTYRPGQSSTLYLASGDTVDWLYALLGVPAFTIELRPRSMNPGFVLPEDEIQPTFDENLAAVKYLMDWMITGRE